LSCFTRSRSAAWAMVPSSTLIEPTINSDRPLAPQRDRVATPPVRSPRGPSGRARARTLPRREPRRGTRPGAACRSSEGTDLLTEDRCPAVAART
jgi:hypothetical protein